MNNKIVFLRTNSRPIPRILRFNKVARSIGLESLFIGAFREKGLKQKEAWDDLSVERIGFYYPMLNGKRLFLYLWGTVVFNVFALFYMMKMRPKIIHVSDIEAFLFVPFYKVFGRSPVIYNIHDNLSQRYVIPSVFRWVLNVIEGLCVLMSTVTAVPEGFRRDALPSFCRHKVVIIKNTTLDRGYKMPPSLNKSTPIVILYAGWIDPGRGINDLVKLAEANSKYKIIVAGEGNEQLIEKLNSHDNVDYRGYLNNNSVLELLETAHFVFSIYNPNRIINRYAASNKVAESLSFGRPLIINSEVKVSEVLAEYGCGVVAEFGDIEAICRKLDGYAYDEDGYQNACENARELYMDQYSWPVAEQKMLKVLNELIDN